MKNNTISFLVTAMILGSISSKSQESVNDLFKQVENIKVNADDQLAYLLSPEIYDKALKYYQEAEEDYKSGGEINKIKENLENALQFFSNSVENLEMAKLTFGNALNARLDALEVNADTFQTVLWENAEETLKDAALELIKGDLDDAQSVHKEAESLYRKAELEAIKANYFESARKLIEDTEKSKVDKEVPVTFELAKNSLEEGENLLNSSRYDTDKPRQLAKKAEYEARHAMYLHEAIEKLKDQHVTMEEMLLKTESHINSIAFALGKEVQFDEGIEEPVQYIINQIEERSEKISDLEAQVFNLEGQTKSLNTLLSQKNEENGLLKEQLTSNDEKFRNELQAQIEASLQKQKELENKIESEEMREQKYREIKELFNVEEAIVYRDGYKVIIRLIGLNFDVGKTEIKPSHFPVLTKVKSALEVFERDQVTIQGHTDSQGSDELNMQLSQGRAEAVLAYLKANMMLEGNVQAVGYGESQPIANNETPEGRSKNRRIDIVITPQMSD